MFDRALAGADLDIAILAAVIQHELEHLRGAGEAGRHGGPKGPSSRGWGGGQGAHG